MNIHAEYLISSTACFLHLLILFLVCMREYPSEYVVMFLTALN